MNKKLFITLGISLFIMESALNTTVSLNSQKKLSLSFSNTLALADGENGNGENGNVSGLSYVCWQTSCTKKLTALSVIQYLLCLGVMKTFA
jgi:hypothetical protein